MSHSPIVLGVLALCLGCRQAAPVARGPAGPLSPLPDSLGVAPAKPGRATDLIPDDGHSGLIKRERHYGAMGTEVLLEVYGTDEAALEKAIESAVGEIARIEAKMTSWDDRSELSAINLAAGDRPVAVSRELFELIERALYMSEVTGGAFDITYASAGKLWDYKSKNPVLPDSAAVAAAKARIGWNKVRLVAESSSVFLPEKGMRIDLGGIAKGYAVERVAGKFRELGVGVFFIKAGGDMKVSGRKDGRSWRIGIRDPRRDGENFAVVPVANTSIATSGDYERFFMVDGVRYHHIIDPRTARPSRGVTSVTIFAKNAELADALSTGVFVLGVEDGMRLVERLREAEAIIVDDDLEVHVSSGLEREQP